MLLLFIIPLLGAQKIAHAHINTSSPRWSHSKPSSKKRPMSLLSLAKGRSPCAHVFAHVSHAGSRTHTSVGKRKCSHACVLCSRMFTVVSRVPRRHVVQDVHSVGNDYTVVSRVPRCHVVQDTTYLIHLYKYCWLMRRGGA